jgi:hypothetical protein
LQVDNPFNVLSFTFNEERGVEMDETIRVKIVDDSDKIRVTETPAASEVSDEELNLEDDSLRGNASDPGVANLVGQLGRLSFNVLALPLNLLPGQSRYHAKNSLREGYMAFKSLVDEVAVSIDESVARSKQSVKSSKSTKIKVEETTDIPPAKQDNTGAK